MKYTILCSVVYLENYPNSNTIYIDEWWTD